MHQHPGGGIDWKVASIYFIELLEMRFDRSAVDAALNHTIQG